MENQTVNLKLPVLHVNAILQALSQAPYAVAAPIIEEIRQQVTPQLVQNTQAYAEPEAKKEVSE